MRKVSVCLGILICAVSAFADYNRLGIPDSSEIRRDLKIQEHWMDEKLRLPYVRQNQPEVISDSSGRNFQIRMEESGSEFAVIVAPEVKVEVSTLDNGAFKKETRSDYPAKAPGSWILYRDSATGKAKSVRFYCCADSEVYIQFYPAPAGSKTLGDMVIFGSYAAKGVQVGMPFKRFCTASIEEVYRWTERTLPWNKFEVPLGMYKDTLTMVSVIRGNLAHFKYAADAAYDEAGNPVSISTGKPRKELEDRDVRGKLLSYDSRQISTDSRGFLKWIVDGLAKPLCGEGIKISSLNKPTSDTNGTGIRTVLSQSYALNSSLDWSRNLAAQILSIRTGRDYSKRDTGTDVRVEAFADSSYLQETGYRIETLKAMLYVLAVTEPNTFYLGAIKERGMIKEEGAVGNRELLVFNRGAALFPYFDSEGRFRCPVFMDGKEFSLDEFISLFSKSAARDTSFVHLSRIKSSDLFFPMIR